MIHAERNLPSLTGVILSVRHAAERRRIVGMAAAYLCTITEPHAAIALSTCPRHVVPLITPA